MTSLSEWGVRVFGDGLLLDFLCGFAEIFISSCGIAVLQNQAVYGIQKFSGSFDDVQFSFVILNGAYGYLCAVLRYSYPQSHSFTIKWPM